MSGGAWRTKMPAIAVGGLLLILAALLVAPPSRPTSPADPSTALSSAPTAIPLVVPVPASCADCPAGYGVAATNGSVTAVSASFVVPPVNCTRSLNQSATGTGALSFFGVILGPGHGDYAYATVEAFCGNHTLSLLAPWFDVNSGTGGLAPWTPSVGDHISVAVSAASGNYTFRIVDHTLGVNYTAVAPATNASLSEARCATGGSSQLPIVDFGKLQFQKCRVTIHGHPRAIGGFGPSVTLTKWTSTHRTGSRIQAYPTHLLAKTRFAVIFRSGGP